MGWIRCVGCKKLQSDFEARTFALIAPVQYVLHQLSCTYKTIPNAPKYYELHWNISLGSNGVDWVRSLQKIQMWHRGTNFCISCTCTVYFATSLCSYEIFPNAPKYYETHQNMSLASNGVGRVHSLRKIPKWLHDTNLCICYTSSTRFATSFV